MPFWKRHETFYERLLAYAQPHSFLQKMNENSWASEILGWPQVEPQKTSNLSFQVNPARMSFEQLLAQSLAIKNEFGGIDF